MFLRQHQRSKDGKYHTHWSLVETVRTVGGPRQRTLCNLGQLNGSAQAQWLKNVQVFNEQARSTERGHRAAHDGWTRNPLAPDYRTYGATEIPTASNQPQSAGTFEISLKM
jgi:hypothetical protein